MFMLQLALAFSAGIAATIVAACLWDVATGAEDPLREDGER